MDQPSQNEKPDDKPASSWWNSLVQTAKEKSANAIEIMRTDLAEFKSTMTTDTTRLVTSLTADVDAAASTTGNLFNSLSSLGNALGINSIITGITSAVGDENEQDDKKSANVVVNPPGNVHDRFKADLSQLQTDEATFSVDLSSPEFDDWVKNFNIDHYKSTISDLLIDNSAMRLIFSQLVPAQMSNDQFWSRYFFKYNQLEEDYKKRLQLLEKASKTETSNEETNDWEDEESSPKTETSQNPIETTKSNEPTVEEDNSKPQIVKSATTKSTEENDDWEKLSDVDHIEQPKPEKVTKIEKADANEDDANNSNSSEIELPRGLRKEADNDWEDWDE